MNDKKSSEDEFFVEDIGEEFDFGDDQSSEQKIPASGGSPRGPNKIVLTVALILIIGAGGYFGYKYFYAASPTGITTAEKKPSATQSTLPAPLSAKPVKTATDIKPTVQAPAPAQIPQSKPLTETPKTPPVIPQSQTTLTESEIAKAFSTEPSAGIKPPLPLPAEAPPTQTPLPAQIPKAPTQEEIKSPKSLLPAKTELTPAEPKEGSIQDLQKELFTPKPKEIPPHPMIQRGPAATQPTVKQMNPNVPVEVKVQPLEQVQIREIKTPPPPSVMEFEQINKTMEAMTQLNRHMENNLNQIKYLDAYTREISETVSKLNSQISAMDNRILALTNTATSLSKDVGSVRNEVGHVKQALGDEGLYFEATPPPVGLPMRGGAIRDENILINTAPKKCRVEDTLINAGEPEYALHAVIPGRAWLKSNTGQILTVTEGDAIGNYGKVLVIDPANGVVLTNSGISFR